MKPVIVGLNNPHSTDPSKALGLEPSNGSGARLWNMFKEAGNRMGFDVREEDYLEGFRRLNLTNTQAFNKHVAKARKNVVIKEVSGCKVVICGTRIPNLLDLKYTGFHLEPRLHSTILWDKNRSGEEIRFTYYVIPHPSGLTREYNDPEMRIRVGNLLYGLFRSSV